MNHKSNQRTEPLPTAPVYYLGIDGGGTKTAYVLADESMNTVRSFKGEGTNPVDIGIELTRARLAEGIREVCGEVPLSCISLFAGIAGGTSFTHQSQLAEFFGGFGFSAFDNGSDNQNIVSAGLGRADGVSIILGTGVCAYRQKDGETRRYSGWGYLFDNGGSAFNIARDGIAAHFEALDGIGPPTAISALLEAENSDPQTLLSQLYRGGKKGIASYARAVYAAAADGDGVATDILQRNMCHAARIIEAAAAELTDTPIPVTVAGGLTAAPLTLALLRQSLQDPDRFVVTVLEQEPVMGALRLARQIAEKKENDYD